MRVILFLIGLALSVDGLYFAAFTAMGAGEALTVTIGILFILWGVFYDSVREKGFLRFLRRIFVLGVAVITLYSAAVCVFGTMDNVTYNEEYVIVLGAGLHGSEPSQALKNRLDTTVEYMNKNKNAKAIVSGGQGKGESISEAEAMERYLTSRGIAPERVFKEDTAKNTYENLALSKPYIDGSCVIITNNFHIARALQMAKINGIDARHIGAPTPITLLPVSCVREFLAQIAVIRYL